MPAIGPFEKVSFNASAHIRAGDNGSVVIATGTDTVQGAEFVFGADGGLSSNGTPFSKGGGGTPAGLATEDYVDAAVDGLASENFVGDQIQLAIGGISGGGVVVPTWTVPALLNGWTARSLSVSSLTAAPAFRVVGHRLELTGDLEAQGAAPIVQAGESCVIFRLPVGARPLNSAKTLLVICGGNTVGTLKVFPDGQVVFLAGSMLGHVSLHGLSFPLD